MIEENTLSRQELEEKVYQLEFEIRKSIRYHVQRKRFFENWHYFSVAVTAIAGSSAFVAVWSKS